jgi:hypothetical protein
MSLEKMASPGPLLPLKGINELREEMKRVEGSRECSLVRVSAEVVASTGLLRIMGEKD